MRFRPRSIAVVVLSTAAPFGCATLEGGRPLPSDQVTVRNLSAQWVQVYTAPDPASVKARLGRVVIGERRTFALRTNRDRAYVIIEFQDGRRLMKLLPLGRSDAFEVLVESDSRTLYVRY
jgi:hypothetical protein